MVVAPEFAFFFDPENCEFNLETWITELQKTQNSTEIFMVFFV
jgi:hypothetical protein